MKACLEAAGGERRSDRVSHMLAGFSGLRTEEFFVSDGKTSTGMRASFYVRNPKKVAGKRFAASSLQWSDLGSLIRRDRFTLAAILDRTRSNSVENRVKTPSARKARGSSPKKKARGQTPLSRILGKSLGARKDLQASLASRQRRLDDDRAWMDW